MSTTVVRSIRIPAPAQQVWDALADADRLGEWLGGCTDLVPDIGSPFTFDDVDGSRHGVVTDVVADRLIEFWWSADDGAGSVVRIELTPHRGDTTVTVTEEPAEIAADMESERNPVGFSPPLARVG